MNNDNNQNHQEFQGNSAPEQNQTAGQSAEQTHLNEASAQNQQYNDRTDAAELTAKTSSILIQIRDRILIHRISRIPTVKASTDKDSKISTVKIRSMPLIFNRIIISRMYISMKADFSRKIRCQESTVSRHMSKSVIG